jgi:hypothetical protein
VVILNEGAYDAWLSARPEKALEFVWAYSVNWLTAMYREYIADEIEVNSQILSNVGERWLVELDAVGDNAAAFQKLRVTIPRSDLQVVVLKIAKKSEKAGTCAEPS